MIQEYVNIIKQIDEDSQRSSTVKMELLKTVDRAAETMTFLIDSVRFGIEAQENTSA